MKKTQNCHAYRQHVMTLVVGFLAFFLLNVEFAEEIEGYDSVEVDYDAQQHHSQNQLKTVAVVSCQSRDDDAQIPTQYKRILKLRFLQRFSAIQ